MTSGRWFADAVFARRIDVAAVRLALASGRHVPHHRRACGAIAVAEGVVAKYSGAPYQGGRTSLWQKLILRRPEKGWRVEEPRAWRTR